MIWGDIFLNNAQTMLEYIHVYFLSTLHFLKIFRSAVLFKDFLEFFFLLCAIKFRLFVISLCNLGLQLPIIFCIAAQNSQ